VSTLLCLFTLFAIVVRVLVRWLPSPFQLCCFLLSGISHILCLLTYTEHYTTLHHRCGPIRAANSQCFIVFSVAQTLTLNCAGVGPNCMLCPTLTSNTIDSAKHVLVLLGKKELEVFREHMVSGDS